MLSFPYLPMFSWISFLNEVTYPFSILILSFTLTCSICSFHRVSFIVPVSSWIVVSATRWTTSLYFDITSLVGAFSVTWASMSTRFIPSCSSFIFKIFPSSYAFVLSLCGMLFLSSFVSEIEAYLIGTCQASSVESGVLCLAPLD
jgi:hypothetical protein